MRLAALIVSLLLCGCANGHLADHIGRRDGIVTPQLFRYGYDLIETRCVSEQLARDLTPRQLRLFARAAGSVTRGYFEPDRLSVRDLTHVSGAMGDDQVRDALRGAHALCKVTEKPAAVVAAAVPAAAAPRQPTWLNLGAAETGQSIAIDGSTIEQKDSLRSAWFRLTDPGEKPSVDIFHLAVDCTARTINPTERKRLNADGSVAETRTYPSNPLPAEKGTVLEIAWVSLCT